MNKLKFILLFLLTAASFTSYADVGAPLSLKMIALDNGETRHIKYNQYTGETWWAKNTTWEKIKESGPVSPSRFQFEMVSTGKSWRLIRLDKVSGKAWKNSFGNWITFETE